MSWRVLVSAPYLQPVLDQFDSLFIEHGIELLVPPVREHLSAEELLPLIGDIDGVIAGDDQFTEEVLKAATRLKVISKWGTGVDSVDLEAAKRLGIAVRNTPGAFSEPVADSVLGYILCFARQIPWMDREIKRGEWSKMPGIALGEAKLGIIGLGDVGKAVVHRALAFGMQILANDIVDISETYLAESGVVMTDKETLLRQADFVSLNCDFNPTSQHIIGIRELKIMQPSAYLINTARGHLIDEAALIGALQSGEISGAGLDVFEEEPLPLGSPLRKLQNVLLTAHNANSSPAAWERVNTATIQNLLTELQKHERSES